MQLHLEPENFSASFMNWHLRDTSRLYHVWVAAEGHRENFSYKAPRFASQSYWEWVPKLLCHLVGRAPALRSLALVPPRRAVTEIGPPPFELLPLIGALSRLELLALREWEYTGEDVTAITRLTVLTNLQVGRAPPS